jgi:hypothetical protein
MRYEYLVLCRLRDSNGNTFYPAGVKRLEWIARPEREASGKLVVLKTN